jgi:hypothetical protein
VPPSATAKNGTMILNVSRNTTVATSARMARSLWARFRGLMLQSSDEIQPGSGLIIDPCSSIHMFFMRFPIDVLYMSADHKVVRLHEAIKPWRIGPLHTRGARYVIELPCGSVRASGTAVGDQLKIQAT